MRAGLASAIHSRAVWRGITVGHIVRRRLLNAWRSFVVGADFISGRPEAVRLRRLLRDNHLVVQKRCNGAVELPGVPLDLHAPLGHSKQKLRRFSGARGGLLSSTNSVFTSSAAPCARALVSNRRAHVTQRAIYLPSPSSRGPRPRSVSILSGRGTELTLPDRS